MPFSITGRQLPLDGICEQCFKLFVTNATEAVILDLQAEVTVIDGDVATIRRLATGGAEIDARDPKGRTPAHVAAFASEDDALRALRQADAKHRLTVVLNRAAPLDISADRLDVAQARASEALQLSRLMVRPSETLQAHVNLAQALLRHDDVQSADHLAAVREQAAGQVASWARQRAQQLLTARGISI